MDAFADRRVNLYEVLQVSSTATPDVLQAAYRALARAYHPDVNPSPEAARKMRQLNAAYQILSDPRRRARYDLAHARVLRVSSSGTRSGAGVRTPPSRGGRTRPPTVSGALGPAHDAGVGAIAQGRGPRLSRVLGLLAVVVLVIGLVVWGFWTIAGILEDEPLPAMSEQAVRAHAQVGVPDDVLSSALVEQSRASSYGRR